MNPPGQASGTTLAHVPVPLHVLAMNMPLLQEAQDVPAAVSWQAPPAAQLPVFPHRGAAAHCPAGAGVPGVMLTQVPFIPPVREAVHA